MPDSRQNCQLDLVEWADSKVWTKSVGYASGPIKLQLVDFEVKIADVAVRT